MRPPLASIARSFSASIVVLFSATLTAQTARAAEQITVELSDGRVLAGEVDVRTNDELLWLRFTSPSIALVSSFPWNDVASAEVGKRRLSPKQFRARAESLKSELPEGFFAIGKPAAEAPRQDTPENAAAALVPQDSLVRSLHIDGTLANWDSDVEADGIELRVIPQNARGDLLPVNGTLSIRLLGQRHSPTNARESFQEIGRWSKLVRAEDFGIDGAVYRLPFQSVHPEFNLDVDAEALVHARLGVPGQGSFESSAPVWVRSYSRLRDELQLRGNKRFFPGERTGR